MNFLKKRYQGRINRRAFALQFLCFSAALFLIFWAIIGYLNGQFSCEGGLPVSFLQKITTIVFYVALLSLIPSLFLPAIIKRLHDIGLSGWFSLLAFSSILGLLGPSIFFQWVLVIGHILIVLFLLLMPGQNKENKYGEITIHKKSKNRTKLWIISAILIIASISVIYSYRDEGPFGCYTYMQIDIYQQTDTF